MQFSNKHVELILFNNYIRYVGTLCLHRAKRKTAKRFNSKGWASCAYCSCMITALKLFQLCCLLHSHSNGGCACLRMAPFSFLIDDYWVQSDGSSLLANTQEETTAKTAFVSDCSLNLRLTSRWQTQTLHGGVLQCPLPSFLCSIPETLWNLQSQHRSLKKGKILLFSPPKCLQSLAACESDLTLNGNSVVSFLSRHYLAAEWRDHFPLDNFRHERPVSAFPFPPFAFSAWSSLGQLIGCTWPKWTVCYPYANRREEIAECSIIRQVLKAISLACFARAAWRQPGGRGNNEAQSEPGIKPGRSSCLTENWYLQWAGHDALRDLLHCPMGD